MPGGGWRGVVDRGLQNRYQVVHVALVPLVPHAPHASALVSVVTNKPANL